MPVDEWENVIAVNLSGGSIVDMSSVGGLIGLSHRPAHTASKHGIVGLTKSLARDLAAAATSG
jgi:NAD(P)-dependent dehydrogenase (short-subunit alcohol dehydrogenase family)